MSSPMPPILPQAPAYEAAVPDPAYFKSWLIFFLIASCGGAVAGGVGGAIVGAVMGLTHSSSDDIRLVVSVLAFLAALPVSFFAFQWSVKTWIVKPMVERLRTTARPPF